MRQFKSRKPNRLKGYDYSINGAYHVTICAKNHQCIFGDIKNTKCVGAPLARALYNNSFYVKLSNIGKIVNK